MSLFLDKPSLKFVRIVKDEERDRFVIQAKDKYGVTNYGSFFTKREAEQFLNGSNYSLKRSVPKKRRVVRRSSNNQPVWPF